MTEQRKFSEAELAQYSRPPAEVPPVQNALVKLLFQEMIRRQISYQTLEKKSGVSFWSVRKWRRGVEPSMDKLSAALSAIGYTIKITAVRTVDQQVKPE